MSCESKTEINKPGIYPPTLIRDYFLAEEMAYAEKPYQDSALFVEKAGLLDEADELRAKANIAGNNAGFAEVESSLIALLTLQARTTAEEQQSPQFEFLPEISPEDEIAAPQLGKNGGEVVARTVATLATLPPDQRYGSRIVQETGFAPATVNSIVDELTKASLVTEIGRRHSTTVSGPKPMLLNPTAEFDHYLQHVPTWRRAYDMRVMAVSLGLDEDGTLDYLLRVGKPIVSRRPLQVSSK
jgi:hypothetical protein